MDPPASTGAREGAFELDPTDAAVVEDPFPLYARIRAAGDAVPLVGDDLFAVASHANVVDVLTRPTTFSSRAANAPVAGQERSATAEEIRAGGWPAVPALLTADPPEHTEQRRLVQAAFGRRRVEQLTTVIERATERLLDRCPTSGHLEVRSSLAEQLPLLMIADALGLPHDDVDRIHAWSDAVVARIGRRLDPVEQVEVARRNLDLQRYLAEAVERRRSEPSDDLLGDLVAAEEDTGRRLDTAELLTVLEQVLVAGNETATRTIVSTVHRLATDPELQARVRAHPDALPDVVEEVLRLESPVQSKVRVATEPARIGADGVPAGARLVVLYGAANRDPAVFDRPDELDLGRPNLRDHVAFGRGAHFCVGAALARAEIVIAVRGVLDRYAHLVPSPDHEPPRYEPSLVHRGLDRLDVVT